MAITEYVLLMRPGHWMRNIGVGFLYFLLLPFLLFLSPLLVNLYFAADYNDARTKLAVWTGWGRTRVMRRVLVFSVVLFLIATPVGALLAENMYLGGGPSDSTTPNQAIAPATPTPTATPAPTTQRTTRYLTKQTTTGTQTPTAASGDQRVAFVTRIVDGDTVDLKFRTGNTVTARLLGVDTPETYGDTNPEEFEGVPNTQAGQDCLSRHAETAKQATKQALLDEMVMVYFDQNEGRRGSYGRLLVYIRHGGSLYNYQLITSGHARVYDSQFEKRSRFYAAEDDAQAANRGLWDCQSIDSGPEQTEPSSGSSELAVYAVHADADGNDHENLDDEYIVLENTGGATISMGGWTIADSAGHTYQVPGGTSVTPGGTITLYTGSGSGSSSELYWGSDSAVWNNGGDTITVRTDGGEIVLESEY